MSLSKAVERPLFLAAVAVFGPLFFAAVLVKYGLTLALAPLLLPLGAWVLVERRGIGLFIAIAAVLVVPQTTSHAWLIPPTVIVAGLLAGAARPRLRVLDVVVGALVLWLWFTWTTHPENGVITKVFLQGVLPFALYFGVRFTVSRGLMRQTLQVVLITGTAGAISVLWDWVTGTVHFADPQFYQWADKNEIFRAGGIFGGSPAAGVCLAIVLVAVGSLLRGQRRWLVLGCMSLFVLAVVIVYARAAWAGLAVGAIAVVLLLPVRERRARIAFVCALSVVMGLAFYLSLSGSSLTAELQSSQTYQQGVVRPGSVEGRQQFLSLALPLVTDNTAHFVFGRGFDAFQGHYFDAHAAEASLLVERGGPHNEYIRAWLEQGIIGFGLVIAWIYGSIALGIQAALRLPRRSDARLLITTLTGSMVVFAGACFFHDWMHSPVTIGVAALVSGLLASAADLTRPQRAGSSAKAGAPA
jgi:O-antigen ligase